MEQYSLAVNQRIDKYLDGLVDDCLRAPKLIDLNQHKQAQFAEEVRDYFYQVILETLVRKLNNEQLIQIENLDPAGPEMVKKVRQLASQIPGLARTIVYQLQKNMEYIQKNSQFPD